MILQLLERTRRSEGGTHMIKTGSLAVLVLYWLPAQAFAEAKEGEAAKGGPAEVILGLLCMLVMLGGAVFGVIWFIRRLKARARQGFDGGFEAGFRGAISSGVDEAFERHR